MPAARARASTSSFRRRLSTLEAERAGLAAEIDALGTEAPEMLLPANLPELYRRKIAELESVLGDGDEGMAAMEMIRSMVDRVVPLRRVPPCDGPGKLNHWACPYGYPYGRPYGYPTR